MVSIPDFWRLLIESRLLTHPQVATLQTEFSQVKGASQQGNARTLSEWLVARNILSRYQAKILGAGRAGPFYYSDYKVYDRLEGGRLEGMFRALHASTGHPVLLQFLTGPLTQSNDLWTAAASRVQTFIRYRHPNLVRVHELADLVSFKFVTIEDLNGAGLESLVAERGGIAPAEACLWIRQAALGLSYLHGRQQVHGDVRPHQFWITADGHLKLFVDPLSAPEAPNFGQADAQADLLVRADYLAPEFLQPGKRPDALTDVYALGCTFYQLLSGRPPFSGGDVTSKLQRHSKEPIAPLETLGIPQPIAQVVAYMMAKNPSVRYPRVEMVAEQLQPFVDPTSLAATSTVPPTQAAFESAMQHKTASLERQTQQQAAGRSPAATFAAAEVKTTAAAAPSPIPQFEVQQAAGGDERKAVASRSSAKGGSSAQRGRGLQAPILIGAAIGAALLIIVAMFAFNRGDNPPSKGPDVADANGQEQPPVVSPQPVSIPGTTDNNTTSTTGNNSRPGTGPDIEDPPSETPPPPRQAVVPDDGKLLWASPTNGRPIQLRYFPPGAQVFLVTRPAAILSDSQGQLVIDALGPTFKQQREAWEAAAGVEFAQISRLTLALYDDGDRPPKPYFAVWLEQPPNRQDLHSRWGNPAAVGSGEQSYYKGGDWTYLVPGKPDAPTFLMGREDEIKLAAELGGAAPPLRRGMGPLLESSNSDRHVTLLAAPNYFSSSVFRDGRPYYFGDPGPIRRALEWLLGDDIQTGMFSMHFEDEFYWELRLNSSLNTDQMTLASDLRTRIAEIPDAIERHVVALNPHPYWRLVAFRYPSMVRYLHRHARVGVEDKQAVINGLLPGAAAHNLVFGGEMVLGAGTAAPPPVVASKPSGPQTVEEALGRKLDMMFDQTSLEFAVRDLATDVNETHSPQFDFKIRIIGADLELAGITRNQQIRDFEQRGKTIAEILTAIVMKANPIATVKEPTETDQKLVWVVTADPDSPNGKIVLITTRDAAAKKNYELSAPFRPKT